MRSYIFVVSLSITLRRLNTPAIVFFAGIRRRVWRISSGDSRPVLEKISLQLLRFYSAVGQTMSILNHLRSTSNGQRHFPAYPVVRFSGQRFPQALILRGNTLCAIWHFIPELFIDMCLAVSWIWWRQKIGFEQRIVMIGLRMNSPMS